VAILDGRARGVLLATVSQAKPLVLIPLSKSGSRGNGTMKYTLINAEDYALVKDYKWQAHWNWTNNSFYARTTLRLQGQRPKHLRLHRMLFGNELDGSLQIDHRNHVTLDNRRKNLRTATPAESGRNRKLRRDNLCGLKGVHRDRAGRWRARIKDQSGRLLSLGTFSTAVAAASAYDLAAKQLHGEFARPNA